MPVVPEASYLLRGRTLEGRCVSSKSPWRVQDCEREVTGKNRREWDVFPTRNHLFAWGANHFCLHTIISAPPIIQPIIQPLQYVFDCLPPTCFTLLLPLHNQCDTFWQPVSQQLLYNALRFQPPYYANYPCQNCGLAIMDYLQGVSSKQFHLN